MIHIYTDGSFNHYLPNGIIGGIGGVILHYDSYGILIKEEFFATRYTKNDILDKMPYKIERMCLNSRMVEFIAFLDIFNHLDVKEEEIHIFSDWDVISTIIEREIDCKRIFFHSPNIHELYSDFKKSSHYVDNVLFGHHIKGHKGVYYNIVADILASYWLHPKKSIKSIMSCYNLSDIIDLKRNLAFRRRRLNKINTKY